MSEQAYIDAINELDEVIKMLRAQLAATQAKGNDFEQLKDAVGDLLDWIAENSKTCYGRGLHDAVAGVMEILIRERNPKEKQT